MNITSDRGLTAMLVCLAGAVGGCATVSIESDPPGAELFLNGRSVGKTPFMFTGNALQMLGGGAEMVLPGHDRSECPQLPPGGFRLTSAPPGAVIYRNGMRIGTSPMYDVDTGWPNSWRLVFSKDSPPTAAGAPSMVAADLRVIAASDGSGIATGSGQAPSDKLEGLAKALAGKIREGVFVKGESVAVVTLRNRGGKGRAVADELADKVQNALIDTGWFDVKERIDLRALLDEKALDTADIIKNADVRKKLAGVKYVVIGGVTVTERP